MEAALESPHEVPKPDAQQLERLLASLQKEADDCKARRDRAQAQIARSKGSSDEINARLQEARTRFLAIKCVCGGVGGIARDGGGSRLRGGWLPREAQEGARCGGAGRCGVRG